jgi:glycerate kinase
VKNNNKILIAPNSFKECANSVTIAQLIRENLSDKVDAELIVKPISDGGDGFLNVCKFYFGGETINYRVSTTYDDSKIVCKVLYCEKRKEIYIESADVLGLKVVPMYNRNPLRLTSKGLGELLKQIQSDIQHSKFDVRKIFLGVGGTATIDMGIGMMGELGLRLLNESGKDINVLPENFSLVNSISYNPVKFSFELIPVIDVSNPLLGINGGVRVFGPQKNAEEETIHVIEENFNHLINIIKNNGLAILNNSLSGAGGGIPAAFQIFYNSNLTLSSNFIEFHLGLHKYSASNEIEYVVTGEGAYDYQSGFGKGVDVLLQLFGSSSMKIFLVCGKIGSESVQNLPKNILPIELRKYFSSDYESVVNYIEGIRKACSEIVKHLDF